MGEILSIISQGLLEWVVVWNCRELVLSGVDAGV